MLSELQKTIINYTQEEKEFMLQLERMSKIDLILYVNNLNNYRNRISIIPEENIEKMLREVRYGEGSAYRNK